MKLISLNTWGGKFFDPLLQFIKQNASDVDIFCFQEIYKTLSNTKQYSGIRANLLEEIETILPNFQAFYFPTLTGFDDEAKSVDFDLTYGVAIWIKRPIIVNAHTDYFIYKTGSEQPLKDDFSNLATPLQYISFNIEGKTFAIFNFHGTPFPADKLDSKRRLTEARSVKKIIDRQKGAKILVGDFNLLPETQSIQIIEEDMRNLIKEFSIQRTRSKLSPFYGKTDFQRFADYTFVSDNVEVKSFQIPRIEISDHLPMVLEFS